MKTLRRVAGIAVCLALSASFTAADEKSVNPKIVKIIDDVNESRIKATIAKLVSFETRNTMSTQDDPVRGIGAARQWILQEFQSYSPRLEVQFDKQPDENRFIRSDQASFVKYGIPALAFKFGWLPGSPEQEEFNDWIHDRYHHPSDDLEQTIDREAAVHFDQVLLTLVRRVANSASAPEWYPESFFSTIPRT